MEADSKVADGRRSRVVCSGLDAAAAPLVFLFVTYNERVSPLGQVNIFIAHYVHYLHGLDTYQKTQIDVAIFISCAL